MSNPILHTAVTCPRQLDRRSFLRDMALAVAAALVANGVSPDSAFAEGLSLIEPVIVQGAERVYAIPTADGVFIDEAQRLVLARWHGMLYAMSVACPHKREPLEWRANEGRLYCPKHKVRWSPEGARVSGRNTRDLDRYALRREGGRVVIALDRVLASDRNAAEWAAATLVL